ncbi:MAG: RNA-binding protein 26 [Marteilia pararefringens]
MVAQRIVAQPLPVGELLANHRGELKRLIAESVAKHCRSDANSVATYILALLGKNKTREELSELCHLKLKIFFHSHTDEVVDILFTIFDSHVRFDGTFEIEEEFHPQAENEKLESIAITDNNVMDDYTDTKELNDTYEDSKPNIVQINWNSCPNLDPETNSCTVGETCMYDHDTPQSRNSFNRHMDPKGKHDSRIPIIGSYSRQKSFKSSASSNPTMRHSHSYRTTGPNHHASKSKHISQTHRHKDNYSDNFMKRPNNKMHSKGSQYPGSLRSMNSNYDTDAKGVVDFKDCNAVIIYNIPKELNNFENLSIFFTQFGRIVDIDVEVDGDQSKSLIRFQHNQSAYRVFKSTRALLNNRFVKVRLTKIDDTDERMKNGKIDEINCEEDKEYNLDGFTETCTDDIGNKQKYVNDRDQALKHAQEVIDVEKQKIVIFKKLSDFSALLFKKLGDNTLDAATRHDLNSKLQETLITLEKIKSEIGIKNRKVVKPKIDNPLPRKPNYIKKNNETSIDNRNKTIILRKEMMLNCLTDAQGKTINKDIPNGKIFTFFKQFGQIQKIMCNRDNSIEIEYVKRAFAEKAIRCGLFVHNELEIPIEWSNNPEKHRDHVMGFDENPQEVSEDLAGTQSGTMDPNDTSIQQMLQNPEAHYDSQKIDFEICDQEFDDDVEITV